MKNERPTAEKDARPDAEPTRSISAMPIHIQYIAKIGQVSLSKLGADSYFNLSFAYQDEEGRPGERWDERPWDAYALRTAFEAVTTETQALDFLAGSGHFFLDWELSWNDFQTWQQFLKIVRQESRLRAVMSTLMSDEHGKAAFQRGGEEVEVLKALGRYPTNFFQAKSQRHERDIKDLCQWFYKPLGAALSVEWSPLKDEPSLFSKLEKGGALIQFFRDSYRMRPVLCITARCALQAIAATVYADRIAGVKYGKCEACGRLFEIVSSQSRKYCDDTCKDTARQRRRRKNGKVNGKAQSKRGAKATKRTART
jgi:hypothetical protein